jgi:hypothetical protein
MTTEAELLIPFEVGEEAGGDHRVLEEAAEGGLEPGRVSVS